MAGEKLEDLIANELEMAAYRVRRDAARAPKAWRPLFRVLAQRLFDPALKLRPLREQHRIARSAHTRAFMEAFGCEPGEYVTRCRIETVAALLPIDGLGIWDCGQRVGFTSRGGFEEAYGRLCHETPTATRARLIAAGSNVAPAPPADATALSRWVTLCEPAEATVVACRELRARFEAPAPASKTATEDPDEKVAMLWWRLARNKPRREQRRLAAGWPETSALFERLLRAAREEGRDDRPRGLAIARLALHSLLPLRGTMEANQLTQLEARARAEVGNAHLLLRDFAAAEAAFLSAADRLVGFAAEPRLRAEILYLESCLRRDQRRFEEALELTRRALDLAGPTGRLGAEIFICEGTALAELGRLPGAIEAFRLAFELLLPLNEPYLAWVAGYNLGKASRYAGDLAAAQAWLERAEPVVRALGQRGPLSLFHWQLGLLAWAQGQLTRAEDHLRCAHAGYESLDDVAHGAVAALDLALAYQQQGKLTEAKDLATELVPQLQTMGLDTEGIVALSLLQQALESETLGTVVLEKVRSCAARVVNAPER